MKKNLKDKFSPLYFLSALGSGGLAISFFMYLQFMVPHKGTPMATNDHIMQAAEAGPAWVSALIYIAMAGLALFGITHLRLLFWNLKEFFAFKETLNYKQLQDSPQAISLMAIPLTLAMSVNVMIVSAVVFIPGLWSVVEYLFPVSLTSFSLIGLYALRIFGKYMVKVIINGDKNFVNTNSLSNLLSIFTFAMIAVGFAAPAAMSHIMTVNAIGLSLSVLFLSLAGILSVVKFTLGFRSIIEKGIAQEGSPSLWIIIPFLTLAGITVIRLLMSLDHHFGDSVSNPTLLVFSTFIVGLQIINGIIGYFVMKKNNYFNEYLDGEKKSAASFSLICPGVAFFVFGMFFLHFGILRNGIVDQFSIAYFVLLIPFAFIQYKTIAAFFKLNKRLLLN